MNTAMNATMNITAWLIRREFWENRAIWVIPGVIGAIMLLAALFGNIEHLALPAEFPTPAVGQIFLVAVVTTFFAVMSIYSTWYLLDCLYADRKDRSVLFWKSLPISDTTTVMSKLATALLVIPLVYFVAGDLTSLLMAFIVSVRASALVGGALWHADLWLQLQVFWLYLIVTAAIWFLPIAAYLLVISAWAKRAVMLWSILPPIAAILVERWFFGTHVIAHQIGTRLVSLPAVAFNTKLGSWTTTVVDHGTVRTPADIWSFLNFGGFLANPATWIGAAVGVALILGAIQLRMRRTEI
jgi:ABC-2 type transport system permease protein